MKHFFSVICFFLFFTIANSQDKYLTKNGTVTFFSKAPIEDITAENNQVLSIIDSSNGNMAISILMKSFLFKKALMQEHFNENYVESDKFPKATFKGEILNFKAINNTSEKFNVKGILTIHGESKEIIIEALISKIQNEILVSGNFLVNLDNFKVKIPSVVSKNIAKNIKVSFDFNHKPFKTN
ncbi:YceI family protein [Polaribacter sp.]|uniref:YceI family protein n=1 Tax=Polaribacter sp. TaxID=1920175 RepID=UPI0040485084